LDSLHFAFELGFGAGLLVALEELLYIFQHPIYILHYIIIPESQNVVAFIL